MVEMSYRERVYAVVERIPPGYVLNYGEIAYLVGDFSGFGARAVGAAMRGAPNHLPCHRVVRKDGAPAPIEGFEALLRMEGVAFTSDGRVNMQKHLWKEDPQPDSV